MKIVTLSPHVRKVCAVGMATLMLSTLALGQNNQGGNNNNQGQNQNGNGSSSVPAVPEANAGWVLIPVMAAVLFFSTRRLWPAKVGMNVEGQKGSR